MKHLKSFFTVNIPYKLLSLGIAIIVWLLVVNINNPIQSRNFISNVIVTNEEVLAEQGKFYTIPEGANTVKFRVTAPRSIIERLSSEDFRAVADMRNLEDDARIPIEITAVSHSNQISISNKLHYLAVEIGEQIEEKFVITPEAVGDAASGFEVDGIRVEPNVISIQGPQPIVSSIAEVRAICDVSGMKDHISENVVPTLLDKAGNRVDSKRLTMSLSTVNVVVDFTNVKEVPIVLSGEGRENPDVDISSVKINPDKIMVKGDSGILNNITEIVIPDSVIDLNTITQNVTTTVDITRYLPEGVTLSDEESPEVSVEIKVNTERRKTVEMGVNHISVKNLDRDLSCEFLVDTVKVDVTGLPSFIDEVNSGNLTGSVDLSGLSEGEHTIRVDMDPVSGCEFGSVTVKIMITGGG